MIHKETTLHNLVHAPLTVCIRHSWTVMQWLSTVWFLRFSWCVVCYLFDFAASQALPIIDPIHTDKCGIEKGCYRVPEGCWEPYCDYIATWRPLSRVGVEYMIEMSARVNGITDRHVSLALSDDTRWVRLLYMY